MRFRKLRFIIYLLRNGTVRNKIRDPKTSNEDLLAIFKISIPAKAPSLRQQIKKKLIRNVVIHNIWGTAAYIKTSLSFHANYLISDSLRLIYTRVPKAASSFLAYEMMKKIEPTLPISTPPDEQINQIAPYYMNRSIPFDKQDFISFSVVRNPFHRIVAVYREFFNGDQTEDFIYETYLFGILKRDMEFKRFINVIGLIPDFLKDRHFKPQSLVLKEAKKKTNIRIFKLEEHSNELRTFLEIYGLTPPKQKETSRAYDYQSYYDMETALKVRSMYLQDIEEFGYENYWNDLVKTITLSAPIAKKI